MATAIIFKIKEPQAYIAPNKQKETPVNMFFSYGYYIATPDGKRKYTPLKFATGEKIKPCYWNDKPVYRAKQVRDIDYETFNTVLDNIEGAVKKVFRLEKAAKRLPNPDQLRELLKKELNLIPAPLKESLNQFIERFNAEIKSGIKLTPDKKTRFRPGTIRNYISFRNQFNEFQKVRGMTFDFNDIGKKFYDDFILYFVNKKQSPNNIGKHVKILKAIMQAALNEGIHNNTEFRKKEFKALRVNVDEIYLTRTEVEKLENLDLSFSTYLETIRNVFLIGIYTAQRFSDYSKIRKENIRTTSEGTKVIDLIQQKTGIRVVIPIMPKLELILEKYNHTVPKTFDQKVNKEIKIIARLAGITEKVPIKKTQGGMIIEKDFSKCDLIKTHTSRRTGASLMFLEGIPAIDIMKLTGHVTESEFMKYIRVTKDQTADNLIRRPYFKTELKVAK